MKIKEQDDSKYNENGVHKGYLSLTRYRFERKPNKEFSTQYRIKSALTPTEQEYLKTLKVYNQKDMKVPMENPSKTTENYILNTPIGSFFIDTQGYNYPRYALFLKKETIKEYIDKKINEEIKKRLNENEEIFDLLSDMFNKKFYVTIVTGERFYTGVYKRVYTVIPYSKIKSNNTLLKFKVDSNDYTPSGYGKHGSENSFGIISITPNDNDDIDSFLKSIVEKANPEFFKKYKNLNVKTKW